MELHAGDQIRLMSSARPGHIDVGLVNGALWNLNCDTEAQCQDPIPLPATAPPAALSQRLRDLISGFGSHVTPIVFTLSRGGDGAPQEAVLRLAENRVDLAPALRSMGPSKLQAKLIPQPLGDATGVVDCPAIQAKDAKPACLVALTTPGLYRLEVRTGDREPQTVLVLAAADAGYRQMEDAFAEAVRVADSWGSRAHPETRHYFLSASLNELARTAGKAR
jgi:hypothetical protein